jgi:cellulose 1,4-beta-cellobiosidase
MTLESLRAARAVVLLAVVVGTVVGSTNSTASTSTCEPFASVTVAGGRAIVQQNVWNSSQRQCMWIDGTSWRITRARFAKPTDGPPASYPSIFRGCHWGRCTDVDPLPIRVGGLAVATSTWRTCGPRRGAYNVAYDLWTNSTPTTAAAPDGSEIMIWLSWRGGVQPAGSLVARTRIDRVRWEVWTTRMSGWNYVAYRRVQRTRSVRGLNLRAFVRDSVRREITDPDWHIIAVEAGFEIWRGGRGLSTSEFRAHLAD